MKNKIFAVMMVALVSAFVACGGNSSSSNNNGAGDTPPAPGTLDTSFGNGGIVITDYFYEDSGNTYSAYNEINAIAIQPDGKIVVAGYVDMSGSTEEDFIIARYNTNGTLDTTFGNNGFILTDFDNKYDVATAIALQSDGKIVVAGITDRMGDKKFAIARYDSDGNLDTFFGTNGKAVKNISSDNNSDYATALAIQSDGKILVAGYADISGTSRFVVLRYKADGSLDEDFDGDSNGNGVITTEFDQGAYANAVVIQNDGKIVVAGYSGGKFALVRYKTDGKLDTTFDSDGKVLTEFGSNSASGNSIALQSDGKIVVAGNSENSNAPGASNYALARYNSDGSLDTNFGNAGKIETYMSGVGNANLYAVKIQSDGKIIAGGYCQKDSRQHFTIVRYTPNGILDTSFGTDGKVYILSGNGNKCQIQSLSMQSDGKIIGGGYNEDDETATTNFAIIRLWP